jgi:hypothetical protein
MLQQLRHRLRLTPIFAIRGKLGVDTAIRSVGVSRLR